MTEEPKKASTEISDKPPFAESELQLYFNGFALAVSAGDVAITLFRQGKPIATLNASFTVAKTLASALAQGIQSLEKETKHTIMTIPEVHQSISKATNEKPT